MTKLNRTSISSVVVVAGLLGMLTGCAVEAGEPGSTTAQSEDVIDAADVLVADLQLSNGQRLGWYEPADGSLLMGRSFALGSEVPTDFSESEAAALSPSELFDVIVSRVPQAVAAGAREALVAAEKRQAERTEELKGSTRNSSEVDSQTPAVNTPPVTTAQAGDVREKESAAIDDAWPWAQFKNLQSCWRGSSWGVEWSYASGDSKFTRVDNDRANVAAGCYLGSVSYRVRMNEWSWSTPVAVTLHAGQGWEWVRTAGAFDFDVESYVHNAAGDGYHHCGHGLR
jgi:hypothetical protein